MYKLTSTAGVTKNAEQIYTRYKMKKEINVGELTLNQLNAMSINHPDIQILVNQKGHIVGIKFGTTNTEYLLADKILIHTNGNKNEKIQGKEDNK